MRPSPRTNSRVLEAVLAALLVCVLASAWMLDKSFLAPGTQTELLSHAVELGILAVPMTLIVVTGGIDLSVGSIMALGAVVVGLLHERGVNIWLASAAAIAAGAGAGLLNGVFVAFARVHPLIVTLATMAMYRGLAEGVSVGRPVSGFPSSFLAIGEETIGGLPVRVAVWGAWWLGWAWLVRRSVWGLWIYGIGSGLRPAEYSGIPAARVKLSLYGLSGLAGGLASVLYVARQNTAKADAGAELELEVITAVVLGGTSIFGGKGTLLGTLLGVLVIHEVRELVSWQWQDQKLILIAIGSILIGSVLLNNVFWRRKN